MAELNLKQITDKLNQEFANDGGRKLIFWYDDAGQYAEDIGELVLANAQVYYLQPDNQFRTKIFLEREDREHNYLLYAPFPKPAVKDNHLEDMLLYSRRFYTDRISQTMLDLGIAERYKPVLQTYSRFFDAKERIERLYALEFVGT